jgi:hypothetical protein
VFWLEERDRRAPQAQNVFVTRLHVRYDARHFPEDLVFHETGDRSNFQGRYVVRHAWNGDSQCAAAQDYRAALPERWETEAMNLAALTGWDINTIRTGMKLPAPGEPVPWWQRLWNH